MDEFRQMITEMNIGISGQRITVLFDTIDRDGSGSIDHKEFLRCLFPGLYHNLDSRGSEFDSDTPQRLPGGSVSVLSLMDAAVGWRRFIPFMCELSGKRTH